MTTPSPGRTRMSASRTSLSARQSVSGSHSAPPSRPVINMSSNRYANTQPSYDFITGGVVEDVPQPVKRTALRQSQLIRPDPANDEDLRARINSLDYELKNIQQERGMLILQHERELRELQAKSDAEFKKYQTSETLAQKANLRYDALAREMRDIQDQNVNEKAALERKIRDLQDQNTSLREDAEDSRERVSDQERHYKYQLNDIETKRAALQETVDKVRLELEQLTQALDTSQARLAKRDTEVESLEAQVIELKTHTGESGALTLLQNQLSDQVNHIRKLESTNREQLGELRRLRDSHKSVQVVEEQKRGLETELLLMKDLQKQLGEAQIQKEILEDEKRTWTSLLERDGGNEFDSPEAVVKALVQEQINHASLLDRLGNTETELSEKDEIIKSLETETVTLKLENQKLAAANSAALENAVDSQAMKRLETQYALAQQEIRFLRARLQSMEAEEKEMKDNEAFDEQRAEQIKDLENLVNTYKDEIQTLHANLSKLEIAPPSTPFAEPRGTKRAAETQDLDENASAQLGPLLRKNKNLQIALQKTTQQSQLLATELQAAKAQLKSLRASSKTRVLELRDNPTANFEAIKMATLKTLKEENAGLLAQLRGEDMQNVKVVPVGTVDALKLDLKDMEKVVAEKEKRMRRQREIWTDKAAEFRDVIASILGYRVQFLPNGKVKISSMFYGKRRQICDAGNEDEDEDEDDDHFIMFDGENGTMKIAGGSDGLFAQEIKGLVDFWVKGRKEIPVFLAAMTMEFYEKFASGDVEGDMGSGGDE